MTEKVLELFKLDLGISSSKRDDYFRAVIESSKSQLEEKGISLNSEEIADVMLVCDFASWNYRHRTTGESIPRNLALRIRNRIMKKRAGDSNG